MWVALEVVTVFKGARLALVDVHHQQPRGTLLLQNTPLAPGRKSRTTEATQSSRFQRLDN